MESVQNINVDELLKYVYFSIYENYDVIMKHECIAKILDVNTNNLCKKLRFQSPELNDREIQCRGLTLLYFLQLFTFYPQWLKE